MLAAAREGAEGRVIAVVQPHRYTRLRDLMDEFQTAFNDADMVYVAPVYAAGEQPIEGVDAAALAEGLSARGHRRRATIAGPDDWRASCAISRAGRHRSSAWARATSPNGRRALADGICDGKGERNERVATLPQGSRQG